MIWNNIEHSILKKEPWSDRLHEMYSIIEGGFRNEIDTFEFKPEGLIPLAEFILEYGL